MTASPTNMEVPSDPDDHSTNPFAPPEQNSPTSQILQVFATALASPDFDDETEPLMNTEGPLRSYQSVVASSNNQLNRKRFTTIVLLFMRFCEFYTSCSVYLTHTLLFVLVLLPLVGLSCVPFYMGIKYLHKCSLMPELPIVFIYLGGSCIVAAISRLIYLISKKYDCGPFKDCWNLTLAWIFISGFTFLTEVCLFYFSVGYPSTRPGHNYCDPAFYKFVPVHNRAVMLVAIILVVLHGPAIRKTYVARSL